MGMSRKQYTVSVDYDQRLYKQDIAGSIAHVQMLAKQDIISANESDTIIDGLVAIREDIENGSFFWKKELEDIHMNIESNLKDKIGPVAGKLHTGRSRNDQIALDMRMFVKDTVDETIDCIVTLQNALIKQAERNIEVVIPGYTHLQRAQPVLLSHHLLAYFEMLERDKERFRQCYIRADVLPLGSGALAGVPYKFDREFLAKELGFSDISKNSMDAVSDRDFVIEYHSAASLCIVHLSRFAEEIVLWTSQEFNLVQLDDEFVTGSSIMPQKRNPDFAELTRGKTGRVIGNLIGMLTVLKGLPLAYNRDLQEDKQGLFDTVDALLPTLDVLSEMVSTLMVNTDVADGLVEDDQILATDVADYLVGKGTPFREAHGIISNMCDYASQKKKKITELSLEELQSFSTKFSEEINYITPLYSVNARDIFGGTATARVNEALKEAKILIEGKDGK